MLSRWLVATYRLVVVVIGSYTVDWHSVEQPLHPAITFILDVRVPRQKQPHAVPVFDIVCVKVVIKVKVRPLDDDESMLPSFDVQVTGHVKLQHAHRTSEKLVAHQTYHSLAVLNRRLNAGHYDTARWKVPFMVADLVSHTTRFAVFQTMDNGSRYLTV